ncbi:MAG: hypothetical protein QG628_330 [Patescibacteria group bacterium]|nr:hypothetical protein [Patescibacteria group bacterium]
MSAASLEFSKGIHEQLSGAIDAGISEVGCNIPVVSLESNRITLGANARGLDKSPHTISLSKHPSGVIRVGITSDFGMACPDPLLAIGLDVARLPEDVTVNPYLQRHAGLLLLSSVSTFRIMGTGFKDDEFVPLVGVDQQAQNLFAAQIAGVACRAKVDSGKATNRVSV